MVCASWCAWRSARYLVRVNVGCDVGCVHTRCDVGCVQMSPSVKLGHEMGKMIREATNRLEIRNGQPP